MANPFTATTQPDPGTDATLYEFGIVGIRIGNQLMDLPVSMTHNTTLGIQTHLGPLALESQDVRTLACILDEIVERLDWAEN
ncbi:hypothetical protein [Rhodococcus marinonascens]|uniref:hypothetical protein n=1 Tax=Rhodococcus marinonascens TaxID=38311 RepID=UPI0009348164|nr:hypothetical protein [Rhodococcus marinonascens]